MTFQIRPGGEYHVYEIDLSGSPEYRGAITGLRLDPAEVGNQGDWVKIRSISCASPAER